MSKILVVAPHPDDETLGCGGTILKHKARGDKVYWLIMTRVSVKEGFEEEKVTVREKEISEVNTAYGFEKVFSLDMPTAKLDLIPKAEMVQMVNEVISAIKPETIYLPYRNDIHSDHKVTFDVVISATKTFRQPSVQKMCMYEVISETEFSFPLENNTFIPNSFSSVEKYIEQKINIMKIYKSEITSHPFPRSVKNIEALATFRGATAGVRYAEAFMILKEIW